MSVYVKYDDWARMGNRMFQYAFGHILAKKRNEQLYSQGLPNFKIPSINYKLPTTALCTSQYGYHNAEMDELELIKIDVIVDSFLQKAKYYTPYRDELVKLFNIPQINSNPDTLVVHVRETDYVEIKAFLGYKFYKKLIDDSGFTKIVIVTDNSNCDTVKRLVADGCTLNTEGYVSKFEHHSDERGMEDFRTLTTSANIAISQSSFSWWAAFLGKHDKVIIPFATNKGQWRLNPGIDDVDLNINLPNYIKFIHEC